MTPARPLVRRLTAPVLLRYADAVLDPRTRELRRGERVVELTYTESRLLALLMRNAPAVVTRQQIDQALWGGGPITRTATDTAVKRLRRKLDLPGEAPLLRTAYGIGYLLRAAPGGECR